MQKKWNLSSSAIRPYLKIVGLGLLVGLYLLIELPGLANAPLTHQDESWISSPAANLALHGVYADPRFKGFAGQEQAYFGFPPLYPLMLALIFKVAGVGLVQARLLSVACGLACLLLTYVVAVQIFPKQRVAGSHLGLLAVTLLLTWHLIEAGPANFLSGVPLLDQGRVVRYDVLVPVFGLAAWWLYLYNRPLESKFYYLLAGVLCGLAGLAHLFGLFWLPVLLVVLLVDKGWQTFRSTAPWLLVGGAVFAWIPWLIYCLSNWEAFTEQGLEYQNQFRLTSFGFYSANLLNEPRRFWIGAGWGVNNLQFGYSPAGWLLVLTLVALLVYLFSAPLRANLKTLLVPLVAQLFFFALLLENKTVTYAITLWPLLALLAAWVILRLCKTGADGQNWKARLRRAALLLLVGAVVVQGALGWARLAEARNSFTPYQTYLDRVAALIPPGSRVIGLHDYWLGLNQFPYHAISTAFFRAEPGYSRVPVSFEKALDELDGNVLLFDRNLQSFLDETSSPQSLRYRQGQDLLRWMKNHSATLLGKVDDPYYGLMLVYRLDEKPDS
jgi:4-amino-4-deoxy-L-arabinose transferase-like glycosyltransferase